VKSPSFPSRSKSGHRAELEDDEHAGTIAVQHIEAMNGRKGSGDDVRAAEMRVPATSLEGIGEKKCNIVFRCVDMRQGSYSKRIRGIQTLIFFATLYILL
jgi:hypothetical protein